jgi:hypothetical protein
MAKTRRKKSNRSPGKPFRNARAYVAGPGDRMTVKGFRSGGGPQIIAKPVGDRKPKVIFVGRQYTGVARSKSYPYAGVKRGGPPKLAPVGLIARAAKRIKRVVVGDGGLAIR